MALHEMNIGGGVKMKTGTFSLNGAAEIVVNDIGFKPKLLTLQRTDQANALSVLYNEDISETKFLRAIPGESPSVSVMTISSTSTGAYTIREINNTGFKFYGYRNQTFSMTYVAVG